MESTTPNPTQIRVYTDGIYDLFHRGHIESINQCKNLYPNTYLIVGVISDNDATNYKRKPIYGENDRYKIIENLKSVDKMIPNAPLQITKEFLDENEIDLVVHGFANLADANKQQDFYTVAKEMNKFKEVPYYNGVSTTDIINKIINR
jgi:choline-phosphate cytidylyltransferase